uniref:Phospholipase A2 n=1 Tax=Ornithorhynchus anatinus TaxID=9258 RepID=K7E996_ORNAN
MIRQTTGKNPIIQYSFYGCYCGIGGKGEPKDATDRCCQAHDCCYGGLISHRCWTFWDRYRYSYTRGVIRCGESPSSLPTQSSSPGPSLSSVQSYLLSAYYVQSTVLSAWNVQFGNR